MEYTFNVFYEMNGAACCGTVTVQEKGADIETAARNLCARLEADGLLRVICIDTRPQGEEAISIVYRSLRAREIIAELLQNKERPTGGTQQGVQSLSLAL